MEINIGLKDSDPVFYISDLLIHMAQDQMKKSLAEGITGEQLQPIIATNSDENQKPKEALMKMFKDTYGIEEEDFAAAELELVPAEKSRDVGFDRSLIARTTESAPMQTWKPSSMQSRASRHRQLS